MKKLTGSVLSLLLAALLALSLFSCGNTEGPAASTTEAPTAQSTEASSGDVQPEQTKLQPNLPDVKYNCEFNIASGYVTETKYTSNSIVAEDITGDLINDAIYERTVRLEGDFGIKINVTDTGYTAINNTLQSGDRPYDLGTATLSEIMKCVNAGAAVNLRNISTIDLEKPWWDLNANEKFRIGNNLYYTLSDFFITGIDNSRCIYFNKTLANDLKLGNLYSLVDSNEWTIEKMESMSMLAKNDNNGDGVYDKNDCVGIANNATTFYEVMLTGCDAELVKQKSDGIPYFCPFDEADFFMDVYTKLLDLFSKNEHYYICSTTVSRDMFSSGNSLFTTDTMYLCSNMRQNAAITFGIMPIPKFNSDQQKYQHVSPNADVFFILPGTQDVIERDGVILEAASYYSSAYFSDSALMPSYFQLALVSKSANDSESAGNLQIVHDNISYVIKIVGTSFSGGIYDQFAAANYNVSSYIKQQKKQQTKALDDVIAALAN